MCVKAGRLSRLSTAYKIPAGEMNVLCIIGWSKSGKTALMEGLIRGFKGRGLKVAALKHHGHKGPIFPEDKDTTRFLKAGADLVALFGQGGVELSRPFSVPEPEVLLPFLWDYDLVLVEGLKGSNYPKVEVYNGSPEGLLYEKVKGVLALVSDQVEAKGIPTFRTHEADALAEYLLGKLSCRRERLTLIADGKKVYLNAFVERMLYGLLGAMITPLKGCEGVKEVVLRWEKDL